LWSLRVDAAFPSSRRSFTTMWTWSLPASERVADRQPAAGDPPVAGVEAEPAHRLAGDVGPLGAGEVGPRRLWSKAPGANTRCPGRRSRRACSGPPSQPPEPPARPSKAALPRLPRGRRRPPPRGGPHARCAHGREQVAHRFTRLVAPTDLRYHRSTPLFSGPWIALRVRHEEPDEVD
jgi:hypothetical protein